MVGRQLLVQGHLLLESADALRPLLLELAPGRAHEVAKAGHLRLGDTERSLLRFDKLREPGRLGRRLGPRLGELSLARLQAGREAGRLRLGVVPLALCRPDELEAYVHQGRVVGQVGQLRARGDRQEIGRGELHARGPAVLLPLERQHLARAALGAQRRDDRADGDVLAPHVHLRKARRQQRDELVLCHLAGVEGVVPALLFGVDEPVRCRHDEDAVRAQQPQHLRHQLLVLDDVLEGFETGHEVERAVGKLRQVADVAVAEGHVREPVARPGVL